MIMIKGIIGTKDRHLLEPQKAHTIGDLIAVKYCSPALWHPV